MGFACGHSQRTHHSGKNGEVCAEPLRAANTLGQVMGRGALRRRSARYARARPPGRYNL
jgi:hypothetical protein